MAMMTPAAVALAPAARGVVCGVRSQTQPARLETSTTADMTIPIEAQAVSHCCAVSGGTSTPAPTGLTTVHAATNAAARIHVLIVAPCISLARAGLLLFLELLLLDLRGGLFLVELGDDRLHGP